MCIMSDPNTDTTATEGSSEEPQIITIDEAISYLLEVVAGDQLATAVVLTLIDIINELATALGDNNTVEVDAEQVVGINGGTARPSRTSPSLRNTPSQPWLRWGVLHLKHGKCRHCTGFCRSATNSVKEKLTISVI